MKKLFFLLALATTYIHINGMEQPDSAATDLVVSAATDLVFQNELYLSFLHGIESADGK